MRAEDTTIFDYRKEKDLKNTDAVLHERLHGKFEKYSVRTEVSGYVDFCLYRPQNADPQAVLPAVFSFHGGGFVLGYYETDGPYCQELADLSGCAVLNVDYCLAPEFKFPKPILSTYQAVCAIVKDAARYRIDPHRVVVCGHSAGGTIAAALCLLDREQRQVGFCGQILDYAPLRQSLRPEDRLALDPSKAISPSRMLQYIQWYFEDLADMDDPLASPLNADLANLPPMLVLSAQYDSLSGEEKQFADKAAAAGCQVEYHLYENCQHGFTHRELKEYNPAQAERAWHEMADFIRRHTAAE